MAGGGHSEKLLTLQWFVLQVNGVDSRQALPLCNSLQSHWILCSMLLALESKYKPILPSTWGRSLLLCSTNHPGHAQGRGRSWKQGTARNLIAGLGLLSVQSNNNKTKQNRLGVGVGAGAEQEKKPGSTTIHLILFSFLRWVKPYTWKWQSRN